MRNISAEENIEKNNTESPKRKIAPKSEVNIREQKFIDKYLETNNVTQSAIYAGYSERSADAQGSELLKRPRVRDEIARRRKLLEKAAIATSQEVMEYFTKVMNGEIKDQFGLEAPLSERTRAAVELAKRTVDLDNKLSGKPDNVVEIRLNWGEEVDDGRNQ